MYKFIKKKYNFESGRHGEVKYALEILNSKCIDNVYTINAQITEASEYQCGEDVLNDEETAIFEEVYDDYMVAIHSYTITFSIKHDDIVVRDGKLLLPTKKVFDYEATLNNYFMLCKDNTGETVDEIIASGDLSKKLLEHKDGQNIYDTIKNNDISFTFGPDYLPYEYYPDEIEFDYEEI